MISLSSVIAKRVGSSSLMAQANAPKVLFGVGITSMVGSTILACRATLKVEDVLDKAEWDLKRTRQIRHSAVQQMQESGEDLFTEREKNQTTLYIYTRTGYELSKLYMPAIGLGVLGVAALTKSHTMLNERYLAVTAAYTALDEGFRAYRERVVDKYGEDEDRQFRYGTEVVTSGDKKGPKKTETRLGPNAASIYAAYFDKYSSMWERDPEYNVFFLKAQQNYWNDKLHARGHVFLNEVYNALGITHSQAGSIVGWILSPEGDNYIDFGIFSDKHPDRVRNFMNGEEGAVLLDFNVDGVIFDKITEKPQWYQQ